MKSFVNVTLIVDLWNFFGFWDITLATSLVESHTAPLWKAEDLQNSTKGSTFLWNVWYQRYGPPKMTLTYLICIEYNHHMRITLLPLVCFYLVCTQQNRDQIHENIDIIWYVFWFNKFWAMNIEYYSFFAQSVIHWYKFDRIYVISK